MSGNVAIRPISRSVRYLHSCRPAKAMFCELEFYEAAVGDITLPAASGSTAAGNCDAINVGFVILQRTFRLPVAGSQSRP